MRNNIFEMLNYSKSELQLADQKFGYLATVNSLLMSIITIIMIYILQNNSLDVWITLSIFLPLIVMQLTSLVLILIGFWPKFKKTKSKSSFYFKDNIDKVVIRTDNEIIDDASLTIKINSRLTNSKYKKLRIALIFTFPPMIIILWQI